MFIPLQNECFQGYTGISLSVRLCVCPYMCPSVYPCVQNISLCQSASVGIKSHLVIALVLSTLSWKEMKKASTIYPLRIYLFTTQSQLLMTMGKKPFENIVGKGENACNQHFLHLPQCYHFKYFDFVVCKCFEFGPV